MILALLVLFAMVLVSFIPYQLLAVPILVRLCPASVSKRNYKMKS